MTTQTAFQPSAFQNDAFQIVLEEPDPIWAQERVFAGSSSHSRRFATVSSGAERTSGLHNAMVRRFDGWTRVPPG